MIPSKKTLSKLKAEIYINSVRLFSDACELFKKHSYASSLALAILSLEELGKLEMVDHICDDISLNPQSDPKDFLENHLFSRDMFFNHKNKQYWATSDIFNYTCKRVKDISKGVLEKTKQNAFYVGYFNHHIRSPRKINSLKAYTELTFVYNKFIDVEDVGFNGFDCLSDSKSRAKAKRYFIRLEDSYKSLNKPKKCYSIK